MRAGILNDLGLATCPPFYRDTHFLLALAAGVVVTGLLAWLVPLPSNSGTVGVTRLVLVIGVWYPALEELLFRGIIQGQLGTTTLGRRRTASLSNANWLASCLFVAVHAFYQPVLWALAVIFPSLIFGHLRDRFGSIYPAFALHVIYNLGFIFTQLAGH